MSEKNFDVIIIGAGTSGLPCAFEAVNAGARVLILEKSGEVGGTLHTSGGHMSGAGSKRQAEFGIIDSVESHLADIERISHGTARKDLASLAVDLGAETIDWLQELDFKFAPESPRLVYGHEPYSVARTYYGVDQGRSILEVFQVLLERLLESNRLDLRLHHTVKSLVTDDAGDVLGVMTTQGERFLAPAVVIATGGFGGNPEMFARLEGAPLVSAAWPTSTGDGIALAEELGANISGAGTYLPTFGGLPSPDGSGRVRWADRPLLIAAQRPPYEIYVDRDGQRFVAEDDPSIDTKEHALVSIPEMTFWTLFDSVGMEESYPMVVSWSREDFINHANSLPGVFSGNTLAEIATKMGVNVVGLANSVSRYNEAVALGKDQDFDRAFLPAPIMTPPFYSLQNHAVTLITFSGIDVDVEFRVRKPDGSTIGGLFAIGEALGAAATMGKSFCGGLLVMPAIAFGRRLGSSLGMASAP